MSSQVKIALHRREMWFFAGVTLAALLLLTFFLYQQTVLYLAEKWNQLEVGDYGHGYLVLLICAYLIFYNRRRLLALTPCPEYRAMVAVFAASMFWMAAALVNIEILQSVGLLLLLLSILWMLLGTGVVRVLMFPVLFIGFAIPIWFPLSPILQELTADVVFWVIRLMEIPALRIENTIVLPAGRLSIEEACSGLRYFLAALTLGTLFAYLNYASFQARMIIVAISAAAAVLANILRVFIVVYLGYTTEMQHPLVEDHLTLGWYLFAGLISLLLLVDTLLYRKRATNLKAVVDTTEPELEQCDKGKRQFILLGLVSLLLILSGPLVVNWAGMQSASAANLAKTELPVVTAEWSNITVDEDGWSPQYHGAVAYKMAYQNKENRIVRLFLGVYPTQRQGEELISDLNKITDDKIWQTSYQKAKVIELNNQLVFEQLLVKNNGTQRLVWYWYRVAGWSTINKYQAKAMQLIGLMADKRQASVVAISTTLGAEVESSRKILKQFAETLNYSLDDVIVENN